MMPFIAWQGLRWRFERRRGRLGRLECQAVMADYRSRDCQSQDRNYNKSNCSVMFTHCSLLCFSTQFSLFLVVISQPPGHILTGISNLGNTAQPYEQSFFL